VRRQILAVIAVLVTSVGPAAAQDHQVARPSPVTVVSGVKAAPVAAAPSQPQPRESKDVIKLKPKDPVMVTSAQPPAAVAAAVAEALRAAEAAAAKRARPLAATTTARRPAPSAPRRRYDVHWPSQRLVVRWPVTATDHVTLAWPETLTGAREDAPLEP